MKVSHFNTDDIVGGAARAAYSIHKSLISNGCASQMLVRRKSGNDSTVVEIGQENLLGLAEEFAEKTLTRGLNFFNSNSNLMSYEIFSVPFRKIKPHISASDILNLHWIQGFLNARVIAEMCEYVPTPILWHLVDIAALTGGCHYSEGCDGFTRVCGRCPQINSRRKNDITNWSFSQKNKFLSEQQIIFIAPTSWIKDQIVKSAIFKNHRIECIPIPINDRVFTPVGREKARQSFGLKPNTFQIFFGATRIKELRKGFHHLLESLGLLKGLLSESGSVDPEIQLLVAGREFDNVASALPFPTRFLGFLNDSELAEAYKSSDLFICPSVEDAGPMMIVESAMCGTPVVAFNTGGAPDTIEHLKTGYLAKLGDSSDLAKGIFECIRDFARKPQTRELIFTSTFNRCSPTKVAAKYVSLCESIYKGPI